MYVSPTGLGQVVPRGVRAIRLPSLVHRRRGMGQASCQFQTVQNPVGTFVDITSGKPITGPPWCAINIPSDCGSSGGLIASCSNPAGAVQVTGFDPANYIPPFTACADGTEVGSGRCCPASVGPAAGQTPQPGCPAAPAAAAAQLPASSAPVGSTSTVLPPPTAAAADCFSVLAQFGIPDPCLGPIGVTTLGAGIVAVLIVASMFGGRKR